MKSETGTGGALVGEGTPSPLRSAGRAPGVLLLHGFTATPREMDCLSVEAQRQGLAVSAPLLPGHGTSPGELAGCRFEDWLSAAEGELLSLSKKVGPVLLTGLSMGSLLAMALAAKYQDLTVGLAVLAPAQRLYSPYPSSALALATRLGLSHRFLPKRSGPDIRDPGGRQRQLNYNTQPLGAANEVRRGGVFVRQHLSKIRCPLFIAHGALDRVCPVANAWEVANSVSTADKELWIFPESAHVVTMDLERARVAQRYGDFIKRVAQLTQDRTKS